jgi:pimeloyl-ACP methyl ester carboxylesterase
LTEPTDPAPALADRHWQSEDGLSLHFRDYAGDVSLLPVLCLHGLTRNARDFAELAAHIAPGRRVIVPEMRGRGMSDYARDHESYNPAQYVADVERLLVQESIERFVCIGTSLGGLMTMLMAATMPGRIAGAVLNDIGPEVESEGLEAIRGYVGQGRSFETWMHAARALRDVHGESHPTFTIEDWLAMAKRIMVLGQGGRIAFDYDMGLAEPFAAGGEKAAPPNLWPAFESLAQEPVLLVRGAHSNILGEHTARQMQARGPQVEIVTIDDTGHAPLLTEPEALSAIDRLLARVP